MSNETTQSMNTATPPPPPKIIAPQKIDVPGQHIRLSTGILYIPPFSHPQGRKVNLIIHFHGASWMAEQNFYAAQKNAVLVTVTLPGLSGIYTAKYKDKKELGRMLNEILDTLDREKIVEHPQLGKLCLTSFSAGFGAMREILQVPQYYKKITDTLFFDSIHAGLDTTTQTIPADNMQMFLKLAKDAAKGKKTMWITHSQIDPITYASTTKTADYLIKGVGATQVMLPTASEDTTSSNIEIESAQPWKKMQLLSTADKGKFHVRGFFGDTAQDHMNHLYTMTWFIQQSSLPDILQDK